MLLLDRCQDRESINEEAVQIYRAGRSDLCLQRERKRQESYTSRDREKIKTEIERKK